MSDDTQRLKALRAVFAEHSNKKLTKPQIAQLSDILDDLSSRFLINLPQEELNSFERICFAIENAHWFYEDYYCEETAFLPSVGYRQFAAVMFHHCPLLQPFHHHLSEIMTGFSEYKAKIPTRGAILIDPSLKHCLIVKGWGSKGSWMFPKGKIDEGESDVECAIRETAEEIGFDITPYVVPTHVVRGVINGKEMRLFVVVGIAMDTVFETRTRKEISEIRWFPIADLPAYGENKVVHGIPSKRMYTIAAVSNKLRSWLRSNKKRLRKAVQTHGAVYAPSASPSSPAPPAAPARAAAPARPPPAHRPAAALPPGIANPLLNFHFDRSDIMSAVVPLLTPS